MGEGETESHGDGHFTLLHQVDAGIRRSSVGSQIESKKGVALLELLQSDTTVQA